MEHNHLVLCTKCKHAFMPVFSATKYTYFKIRLQYQKKYPFLVRATITLRHSCRKRMFRVRQTV